MTPDVIAQGILLAVTYAALGYLGVCGVLYAGLHIKQVFRFLLAFSAVTLPILLVLTR
jgi:hypothetical protein